MSALSTQGNTILIVDDNPINLEILYCCLDDAKFEVYVAYDGLSAIEIAESVVPDLILLDVMMPEIDGFETCLRLKQNLLTQHIPVIFMTALIDTDSKVKGLNLGAVDYITKPFHQEELLVRVRLHLKMQSLTKELELQNHLLHQENQERTLAQASLKQALEDLQQTQTKLVQSEKMSSLGQLVAGVLHEINNPVNFIYGNLSHTSAYIDDIVTILQLYQKYYPDPVSEIQAYREDTDLDFIQKDLQQIINSMKLGTKRIHDLLLNLRNFSRLDEAQLKRVDIHEGLENTLTLLKHRWQTEEQNSTITVVKEYGNVPPFYCYPGELNQVFMNIINNALDALQEAVSQSKITDFPKIWLISELKDERVKIRIKDNGLGMSPQVHSKIFDPFFTTKPVGKGQGLGLSISYQVVVEQHGGNLECISAPGQGTELLISIPFKQEISGSQ